MSVTNVIPKWEGRGATTDEAGVRTLKRAWVVETDSDATGEPDVIDGVIAEDATAALYQPHPDWPRAVCRKLDAAPHNGPRTWWVTAEYSSRPFAAAGDGGASGVAGAGTGTTPAEAAQGQDTPANERPPTVTIDSRELVTPHTKSVVDDSPHVNTVGDPFDPAEELPHAYHVITWTFFRGPSQLQWETRSQFLDSVNNAPVNVLGRIYDTDTLRCTRYSPEAVWETGASGLELFFKLTVVAEEDPRGYLVSTLNTGRREAGPKAIVDENGQPVADPVPLDVAGVPVAGPPFDPDDYHHVETAGYLPKAWNGSGGNLFGTGGLLG